MPTLPCPTLACAHITPKPKRAGAPWIDVIKFLKIVSSRRCLHVLTVQGGNLQLVVLHTYKDFCGITRNRTLPRLYTCAAVVFRALSHLLQAHHSREVLCAQARNSCTHTSHKTWTLGDKHALVWMHPKTIFPMVSIEHPRLSRFSEMHMVCSGVANFSLTWNADILSWKKEADANEGWSKSKKRKVVMDRHTKDRQRHKRKQRRAFHVMLIAVSINLPLTTDLTSTDSVDPRCLGDWQNKCDTPVIFFSCSCIWVMKMNVAPGSTRTYIGNKSICFPSVLHRSSRL